MMKIVLFTMLVTAPAALVHAEDEYPNAQRIIRQKCQKDWPTDFMMQAACVRQQQEGLQELRRQNSQPRKDFY